MKIGNQCRRLLGQMESELDLTDAMAAAAYGDGDDPWVSPLQWLPPPPKSTVAVGRSGLHGDGLVALSSFDIGQEIFREEPLAMLHCGSSAQADMRRAAMRLIGSGQVDAVLRSSLCRGPADGPKARELADRVEIILDQSQSRHRDSLFQALRTFAFNAFATHDDSAQALYATICKANHSCAPNASVVATGSGLGQLVCIRRIVRGEEVTVSYLNAREMYMERRERILRLKRGWGVHVRVAHLALVTEMSLRRRMPRRPLLGYWETPLLIRLTC
eukprot:UN0271